jgi:hypothetical protein
MAHPEAIGRGGVLKLERVFFVILSEAKESEF